MRERERREGRREGKKEIEGRRNSIKRGKDGASEKEEKEEKEYSLLNTQYSTRGQIT